jgi:DNA-binding transcriptional regulator YdaS (Cro superfamily)
MDLKTFISTPDGQVVSQAEWARRVEVTRGYFCQLRDGNKTPSLEVALRIEKATGGAVTMYDWLESEEGEDLGGHSNSGLRGDTPEEV